MYLSNNPLIIFIFFMLQYLANASLVTLTNKIYIDMKNKIILSILLAFISTWVKILMPYLNLGILSILNILLFLVSCIMFFKTNIFAILVSTGICSAISFLTNTLCFSFNIVSYSKYYVIYNTIIFVSILFFVYKYLYNHNFQKFIYNQNAYISNLSEMYLLVLIIAFLYNPYKIFTSENVYFLFFIQTFIIIILIKAIKSNLRLENMKVTTITMNLEYKNLKSIVDDIRMFKHDYNNTLCSIGGYISLNDMNGLKKFYNKLTFDINKTNNTQIINSKTINEPSIYNLLIAKHNEIIEKNLMFNFYSSINFKELTISPYDFSKILGIFLDNAIDAASKSIEKEISLSCEMNKTKDFQITIKNSYINKDVDIEKIFLKGYSSKAVKSGLRFMGGCQNYKDTS